jgi:hypothetical protein
MADYPTHRSVTMPAQSILELQSTLSRRLFLSLPASAAAMAVMRPAFAASATQTITENLAATPLGAMHTANKNICWNMPNPLITKIMDDDPQGQYFSVVATDKGNAMQLYFPKGSYNVGPTWPACPTRHMLYLPGLSLPVSLEWDFYFKFGFDLSKAGKIGPQICWGEPWGDRGGLAICIWWRGGGKPDPAFQYVLQKQRRGSALSSEFLNAYSKEPVQLDRWYHHRLEAMGGAGGYSRYYLDGELMAQVLDANHPEHPWSSLTHTSDPVEIPVCGWFGGDASYKAKNDSYFLMTNIQIRIG